MIKLAFADILRSWRIWIGAALLAMFAAGLTHAALAYMLSIVVEVPTSGPDTVPGLQSHLLAGGAALLLACVVPSLVVLAVVLGLVATQQEESHALWRLGGASPSQVWATFMTQTAISTVIGAVAGILISLPILQPVSDFMVRFGGVQDFTVPSSASVASIGISFAATLLVGLIAASLPALRAARTSIIDLIRERKPRGPMGVFRWILTGIALMIFLAQLPLLFAVALMEEDEAGFVGVSLTLGQILVVVAALLAPVLFPPFLRLWTKVIPSSVVAWWTARHTTRARLRVSTATVTPLMVAIGLYGVYFGVTSVWQTALRGSGQSSDINLLDGFLLFTPGALVAAIASIIAIFMVSRSRNSELAVLRTATASTRDIVVILVAEAFIYTVTALLLALVVIVLPITLLTSIGLVLQGLPFSWQIDFRIPGALTLFGFVGTLLALLATGVPSLKRPVRESLSRM